MARAVTMYEADDGTLLPTEDAVASRNAYLKNRDVQECLVPLVQDYLVKHHFMSLHKSIAPFGWDAFNEHRHEQDRFAHEVSEMIVVEFETIQKLIKEAQDS